jgi:hypothetical protein
MPLHQWERQNREIATMDNNGIRNQAMRWVTTLEMHGQEPGGASRRFIAALKRWIKKDPRNGLAFIEAVLVVEFSQTVLRDMWKERAH